MIYKVGKAAELLGVSRVTLQKWDREGKLVANRNETNRRYYTDEQINNFLRKPRIELNRIVAYCRVSSPNQRPDLKNQRKCLEEFCKASGIANVDYLEEIGGGLNFNRPVFLEIIHEITVGRISKLIVAHKDRLCRFGFELIKNLCDLNNCELLVVNVEKLSPEQEMVQDLMTIIHCFSSRLYGLRNYKKTLQKALEEKQPE
jgi:predicted site-specific integrase-resolvase